MFGQVGGHDHPSPVMHPAGHIHLTHCRIDKRHSRAPLLPGDDLGPAFIGVPWESVPVLFPVLADDTRRVIGQMIGKLTPDQFFEKRLGISFAVIQRPPASMPAGSRADLSVGQIFGQAGGAVDRGQIPVSGVTCNIIGDEAAQTVRGGLLTDRAMGSQNIRAALHGRIHVPILNAVRPRPATRCRDLAGLWQRGRLVDAAHGFPHGRKDLVKAARLGFDRPGLEQDMPPETPGRHAAILQRRLEPGIPLPALRIIKA